MIMRVSLSNLWFEAWSLILSEMEPQEISWLVSSRQHISLLSRRRFSMIISRVRLVAGLFAVLTPLWIVADVLVFPPKVWVDLVIARLVATLAFIAILMALKKLQHIRHVYFALASLLAVPTAFFLYTYQHMALFQMHGLEAAFATGYAFLPFVMLAGLSVFPLTLSESIIFSSPLLGMELVAALMNLPGLDWAPVAATFWLLVLIAAVSALAGISQLSFMIVLVREAIRDGLTGCFSRQSGEELMELQFSLAQRSRGPLVVAFIDLDHFKRINDTWGHDTGDRILKSAVSHIRETLRTGDMLVRWGGEEFVLLMPATSLDAASAALSRLQLTGIGEGPDGSRVTASIGVAERLQDRAENWHALVELADNRMYQAKHAGRNRIVTHTDGSTD